VPPRRALITGVTGQDGWYLAELLLSRGYEVAGTARNPRAAVPDGIEVLAADLREPGSLQDAVAAARPDELYHLAAPTFVPDSWKDPAATMAAIAGATEELLAAAPDARLWIATSSEIFGDAGESPQHEDSPKRPRSPYGEAKLAAHRLVGERREQHGAWACSGITYNHESPRRPERFVTRRITCGVAAIKHGRADELVLGDLDAVRDWSHAADVVRAAWLALQADAPDDYVIASGVGRTVREFAQAAFAAADLDWTQHVRVDPELVRPSEATTLVGDPSRARTRLGWEPERSFEDLVAEMVAADISR
jgi:GDPmannose 4,6-dehydratase